MSSTDSGLYLDWCSEDAAKYACERWHYSGTIPKGKRSRIGVWEGGHFIGAIIYGTGANVNIGSSLGLDDTSACELMRVALTSHEAPVTRIMSISRSLLTEEYPGLQVVVSYADPKEDHTGTIYQADNWTYLGKTEPRDFVVVNGTTYHPMAAYKNWGTSSVDKLRDNYPQMDVERETREGKHKYMYPLTDAIERKLEQRSQPYP